MSNRKAHQDRLYANLMEEAKVRVAAIEQAINLPFSEHPAIIREFCYLQLRMLCELTALASLVAHGDIAESKTQKKWEADKILKDLGALHPDFYPTPVKKLARPAGVQHHVAPISEEYLTKSELFAFTGMFVAAICIVVA